MTERAFVRTSVLNLAYQDSGPPDALPVVLSHGFPYDAHAFDDTVAILNAAGFRAIVPDVRGYAATTFLSADTPRSGEQAAVGQDLLDLLDALNIPKAVLAGFDWGGRAACVVSALWPARVHGLVTCAGYLVQDIARSAEPADPEQEARFWYQYYFHLERGRNGLRQNRYDLCKKLWAMWSPTWAFDDATYDATARSFGNPDFVDVVIHAYRHRTGNAAGDPRYAAIEARLAAQPTIGVPTIAIHGEVDSVLPVHGSEAHRKYFVGSYERRVLKGIGHNPPQEAPQAFADAVLQLCRAAAAT